MGLIELIDGFLIVCNFIGKTVVQALWISSEIGEAIFLGGVILCSILKNVSVTVLTASEIIYIDFIIFIDDVLNKLNFLISITTDLVYCMSCWISDALIEIRDAVLLVSQFVETFLYATYKDVIAVKNFLFTVPVLLKEAFILIGLGIWNCAVFIPCNIFHLLTLCFYVAKTSGEELFQFLFVTYYQFPHIIKSLITFVSDVPLQALAGFILGVTTFAFGVRNRVFVIIVLSSVYHTVSYNVKNLFVKLWTHSRAVIFHFSPSHQRSLRAESLMRQLEIERTSKLCIVCYEKEKCIVTLPCQHFSLCADCVNVIYRNSGLCPVCRRHIDDVMPVYVS